MKTRILLTFDLEEFDLPGEFGYPISDMDQVEISDTGLQRLLPLLSEYNIQATFFTTSFFAGRRKEIIRKLSEDHEITSHSRCHTGFSETDPAGSKKEIENIIGKSIHGFRMPRFRKIDLSVVKAAGYTYDSSYNPAFIPGRYNNLSLPRRLHRDKVNDIIEIPVSVGPVIRFPLFWLSFKRIPLPLYINMCKGAIKKDSYLHLYFHPWEFADLESFKIPWYIKTHSGNSMSERFEKLIVELREMGDFSTISGFLNTKSLLRITDY